MDRLKDDFLKMISHEIRTPANGILNIGEFIIDLCPVSEECTEFSEMFRQSSQRLCNLVDDAVLISSMENITRNCETVVPFASLIAGVIASLPDIWIDIRQDHSGNPVVIKGDKALMTKALSTMTLIAACFSSDNKRAFLTITEESPGIRLQFSLDALTLSEAQAVEFFRQESIVRGSSAAEPLALSPVVAHKIIRAFGGDMKLIKGDWRSGFLEGMLVTSCQ